MIHGFFFVYYSSPHPPWLARDEQFPMSTLGQNAKWILEEWPVAVTALNLPGLPDMPYYLDFNWGRNRSFKSRVLKTCVYQLTENDLGTILTYIPFCFVYLLENSLRLIRWVGRMIEVRNALINHQSSMRELKVIEYGRLKQCEEDRLYIGEFI